MKKPKNNPLIDHRRINLYTTKRIQLMKDFGRELEDIGPDYGYFQNAKTSYKTLKKINKLLDLIK
tara:strand:- start:853 stop:1047 length:195 start_codon:yes stop_codon:yes gene_type:complete